MANTYHDFTADQFQPTGNVALLHGLNAIGEAYAAHKQQQQQQQDAIKLLMMKAQIESQNSVAQEKAKQQGEFDIENQRIDRAKKAYPGMFPDAQTDAAPAAPVMPAAPASPTAPPAMSMPSGGVGDVAGNPIANPVNAAPMAAAAPVNRIKNPVTGMSGWDVNPNFMLSGKGEMFAKKPDNSLQLQDKQSQFNQREWDKVAKELDPTNQSPRTPLGKSAVANYQANRALKTLQDPMVTYQEFGNVMADVAGIYQGGTPTEFGMSHQQYKTFYATWQELQQQIKAQPMNAVSPEIKARVTKVLNDMKVTNKAQIKQHLDILESTKRKVISSFPDEWKDAKDLALSDNYSGLDNAVSSPSFTPEQAMAEMKRRGIK